MSWKLAKTLIVGYPLFENLLDIFLVVLNNISSCVTKVLSFNLGQFCVKIV